MPYKEVLGVTAVIVAIIAYLPYISSILNNKIKPHIFSWVIWSTTSSAVFIAQIQYNAGIGAATTAFGGFFAILISITAYTKRGNISITQIDWVFLISAIIALLMWYLTSNALLAVITLTTIEILGYGPTVRKTYYSPHSENLLLFFSFIIRSILSILALKSYSIVTVLFPASITVASALFIIMVTYRKTVVKKQLIA